MHNFNFAKRYSTLAIQEFRQSERKRSDNTGTSAWHHFHSTQISQADEEEKTLPNASYLV